METSVGGVLAHLWSLIRQSFHYLRGSIEWTSTVSLKKTVLLEVIGKAEVGQLREETQNNTFRLKSFSIAQYC